MVTCTIENVGFYKKLSDRTAVPGVRPARLNEDGRPYGHFRGRNKLDLNLGTEGFADLGGGDKFQSFFDYLKKTNPRGSSLEEVVDADFISNRRILKQFTMAGHYVKAPLRISAVRKNGVIFLCEVTDNSPNWEDPYPYGYKFEQYMTLDDNNQPYDKYASVSNAESTKVTFRTTLTSENETIKVFYAAEVDAIDSEGKFIEMKTSASSPAIWLKNKSLDHYAQSFLANIHSIVYGYKKVYREEVVYEVKEIPIGEIPGMVSQNLDTRFIWNFDKCLEKLFSILQEIKSRLQYDDEALTVHVTKDGVLYEPEEADNCTFVDPQFLRHFD